MSLAKLDTFYSDPPIEEWAAVLGPGMHYHFGFFLDPKGKFIQETLEDAQRRTVKYFYPWIPDGARVLDIGCGWGAPAQMMIEDKGAEVTGITISQAQAAYCRERGLNVEVLDVEQKDIPGSYDVGFLLEVLEHIRDKHGLFRRLRSKVDRLLLSTRCYPEHLHEAPRVVFGGGCVLSTVSELKADLEAAGWRIEAERDRSPNALPTYVHWKRNLDRVYGKDYPPGQMSALHDLSVRAIRGMRNSGLVDIPLIDIAAF